MDPDLENKTGKIIVRKHPEFGYTIIIHPDTPGNVHYAGMGRPCPKCKRIWFCCIVDLNAHMAICQGVQPKWRPSKYGPGEIMPAGDDPELAAHCRRDGVVYQGNHKITLESDGKWLKKVRI